MIIIAKTFVLILQKIIFVSANLSVFPSSDDVDDDNERRICSNCFSFNSKRSPSLSLNSAFN